MMKFFTIFIVLNVLTVYSVVSSLCNQHKVASQYNFDGCLVMFTENSISLIIIEDFSYKYISKPISTSIQISNPGSLNQLQITGIEFIGDVKVVSSYISGSTLCAGTERYGVWSIDMSILTEDNDNLIEDNLTVFSVFGRFYYEESFDFFVGFNEYLSLFG